MIPLTNHDMACEDKHARYLIAIDQVVQPFLREMDYLLNITLSMVHNGKIQPDLPSLLKLQLKHLHHLDFTVCHAFETLKQEIYSLSAELELVCSNVETYCLELIENELLMLHNKDTLLARKVSLQNNSLKDMLENLSQLPIHEACTTISDVYSSLQRGVEQDITEYAVLTLRKEDRLTSKIRVTKDSIENSSLERRRVRSKISNLEDLYKALATRSIKFCEKISYDLIQINKMQLTKDDIEEFSQRLQSLKTNPLAILYCLGLKNLQNYLKSLKSNNNMDMSAWILSEGRELKPTKCCSCVLARISINNDIRVIKNSNILRYVNPVLLLEGIPGSGKSVLTDQIVQKFLNSSELHFHGILDFDYIVKLKTNSIRDDSFHHYIKNVIFKNSLHFDDPLLGLQNMKTLFIIDFNSGFSKEVSLAISELIRKIGENKVLISCRQTHTHKIQKLLKKMNVIFNTGHLQPFTKTEVFSICMESLSSLYPRSSSVEEMAKKFSYAFDYKTQSSLLYPLPLLYLIKLWRDDQTIIPQFFTTTQVFNYMYDSCKRNVEQRERNMNTNDPQKASSSSSIFLYLEEEARNKLFRLSGSNGFFTDYRTPMVSFQPAYPFVVSFNDILNNGKCQLFFVHPIVAEYLAASYIYHHTTSTMTWSMKKKLTLPQEIMEWASAKSNCGLITHTYTLLCSLMVESGKCSSHLIEFFVLQYKNYLGDDSPVQLIEWFNFLRESNYHPAIAKCISDLISKTFRYWMPSSTSPLYNNAAASLIKYSAYSPKEVIITSVEPGLKSVLGALKTQPSINVSCNGGLHQVDEIVSAFECTRNLTFIQGTLSEKGCSSIRFLQNVRNLDITLMTFQALETFATSMKQNSIGKNLVHVSLELNFNIEPYQCLPQLSIGKSHFTLRLNGSNLETPAVAARVLLQLKCQCDELILNDMKLPSIVSRDLRKFLHPTRVTINTIYNKSVK